MNKDLTIFAIIIAIVVVLVAIALMYRRTRSTIKTRYTNQLADGHLYLGGSGKRYKGFSISGQPTVAYNGLITFVEVKDGVESAVGIKLGLHDFFVCYGLGGIPCEFRNPYTLKICNGDELLFHNQLADVDTKSNCVTGHQKNGADFALHFGSGVTVLIYQE